MPMPADMPWEELEAMHAAAKAIRAADGVDELADGATFDMAIEFDALTLAREYARDSRGRFAHTGSGGHHAGGHVVKSAMDIARERSIVHKGEPPLEEYAKQFGAAAKFTPSAQSEADATAMVDKATRLEPVISRDVMGAAKGLGSVERFAFRLKTPDSLARKLDTVQKEQGYTREQAMADMKDVNRYTIVTPAEGYWKRGDQIQARLLAAGNKINKPTKGWDLKGYRGRNLKMVTADGHPFEVQIHTIDSLAAADRAHYPYNEARLPTTTPARRHDLNVEIGRIYKKVPVPPGTPTYVH